MKTASRTLNTVVLRPTVRASVAITAKANPGPLRIWRAAYNRSCTNGMGAPRCFDADPPRTLGNRNRPDGRGILVKHMIRALGFVCLFCGVALAQSDGKKSFEVADIQISKSGK